MQGIVISKINSTTAEVLIDENQELVEVSVSKRTTIGDLVPVYDVPEASENSFYDNDDIYSDDRPILPELGFLNDF